MAPVVFLGAPRKLPSEIHSHSAELTRTGGAERLVVDAAVSLQRRGHDVVMFTSRHDPKRCFEETRDGELEPRRCLLDHQEPCLGHS